MVITLLGSAVAAVVAMVMEGMMVALVGLPAGGADGGEC